MYAVVDCDNCFASCERVFQPELKGRPLIVLGNNDGCVIARSNEAKALGIGMGVPAYQIRHIIAQHQVQVRAAHYAVYADLSNRLMSLLRREVPQVYAYSIDEAFLDLRGQGIEDLRAFGMKIVERVERWIGLPVSIGIASTKTLAKLGTWYAKHYAGYGRVCVIGTETQRTKALQGVGADEVWGIGRRTAPRLAALGIRTAYDLTQRSEAWVHRQLGTAGVRTWRELRGTDCIRLTERARRQSICTSRTFATPIADLPRLEARISDYAARCAARLRKERSIAQTVTTFAQTSPYRQDLPQMSGSMTVALTMPASSDFEITQAALRALRAFYRPGYEFKRAGVTLGGITGNEGVQTALFDTLPPEVRMKYDRLSKIMDDVNRTMGHGTLRLGNQVLDVVDLHNTIDDGIDDEPGGGVNL